MDEGDVPVSTELGDDSFALTAVRMGLVQETQISECRKIQTAMREMGISEQISRILTKKGYLDESKVQQILKALGVERELIPGFQIQAKLGQGGMATVYKARQISVDRTVALKILADFASRDELYIRRFLQEARTAAKLNHRNIVAVYDAGVCAGRYFLVMEYIQGRTLREILFARGPLPPRQAAEILVQVTDALEYLSRNRLLHRDIKPENIMLTKEGIAKLADFGLAKSIQVVRADQSLTRSGCIMGTPFYMSPEQIRGHRGIDIRSDLYSLGCTLYFILTREPPFVGKTPVMTMQMHLREPAPDVRERMPAVPAELAHIAHKLMEKDPELRYPTPGALREDLRAFLRGQPATLARQHAAADAARKAKRRRALARRRFPSAPVIALLMALAAAGGLLFYNRASGASSPALTAEQLLRRQTAEATALLLAAEDDMRSGRWLEARSKLHTLLTTHGAVREIASQTHELQASLARCQNEIRDAEETVRFLVSEARRFEETGAWNDAAAKYELALSRSLGGDVSDLKTAASRCRREREAEQIFSALGEALRDARWATALSLTKFLKEQFADTRTLARHAQPILEAEGIAAAEQEAEKMLARARAAHGARQWAALHATLEQLAASHSRTATARDCEKEILALREAWNQANRAQADLAAQSVLAEADGLFARKQWLEAKLLYLRFLREFGSTASGADRRTYANERAQKCQEEILAEREAEAGLLFAQLRDRFAAGLWEEALTAAASLLTQYSDTRLAVAHKGEISRIRSECESRTADRIFFEETFEGVFRSWQPESQKRPHPSAHPSDERHEGQQSCRLSFTGAGGSFHRLVYPIDRIDPAARKISFWARAVDAPENRALLVLVVLREASSEGTEQFVKEVTLSREWRFIHLDLEAFRRTWGTHATDGKLQIERVTGLGFEPLPTDKPLDILIDQIRFLSPK